MKIFTINFMLIFLSGCSNMISCDNNKNVSIFKSTEKDLVDKIIQINDENELIIKSSIRPNLINLDSYIKTSDDPYRSKPNKKIIIKAKQHASISGYHTDECGAKGQNDFLNNILVDLTTKKKNKQILVESTGENSFIHHNIGFSEINIFMPRNVRYRYIPKKLKNRH